MAFDSAVLNAIISELRPRLQGARINKIHQTDKHTVLLRWRSPKDSGRLLLCAHPKDARLHQTAAAKANPAQAPLFAMVLRKWLEGAVITDLTATPGERVAELAISARNDLGDIVPLRLILEIMGKHSNLILVGAEGNIIDGIHRYSSAVSRWREVLPGRPYRQPPPLNKLPLPPSASEDLVSAFYDDSDCSAATCLQRKVAGLSPWLAAEVCLAAGVEPQEPCGELGAAQLDNVYAQLCRLAHRQQQGDFRPTWCFWQGKICDFSAFTSLAWPQASQAPAPSMNEAVDAYYIQKEEEQELHSRRQELLKQLQKQEARLAKKIAIQESDLARCERADEHKQKGDLLAANLWRLEKGLTEIELPTFADPEQTVKLSLDPALSPQDNISLCYRRYTKARKSRTRILEQLTVNKEEAAYAASIRQALLFADSLPELEEPTREMTAAGYLPQPHTDKKKAKEAQPAALPPRSYQTKEGFSVLIGRNNRQNDRLSLKMAAAGDIWLHAHEIPGSHVILRSDGREVPESELLQAASWAAWFSQGRDSEHLEVDILPAERLRKPAGARPGYVIYTGQRTVRVQPTDPAGAAQP